MRETVEPLKKKLKEMEMEREKLRKQLSEMVKREKEERKMMEEEWERRMQEVKSRAEEAVRRLKQEEEELKRGAGFFKIICKNSYIIVKHCKIVIIFIHRCNIVGAPEF